MSERCVLGTDIGGTFTDVVLTRGDGRLHVAKQLTSPDAPEKSVLMGVERVLADAGVPASSIVRVVHGTTLATNAVIERRGARVAFVTTEGFGDLLRIGREARVEDDRYDLLFEPSPAPLAREAIFEVPERVGARGEIVRPLDETRARAVATTIAELAPQAIALCLLHAYANPSHEERMAEILAEHVPNARVVPSSRVHAEMREFDRASTTLFTAEVAPLMASYLARLGDGLAALGIDAPLQIMESSGGVMAAEVAAERAVATLESGGAAGVMAAARFASAYSLPRVISFDMGGTTAKAGVVRDGRPAVVRELHVGGRGSFGGRRAGTGMPIKTPTIDLAEVGAGGGSIAWLDPEGVLRVGPRSAGADPGPACYALGGTDPTVTDANLVLGYLSPERFAGGHLTLDPEAARRAIERAIADPLGTTVERAAWAIHEAANANMASAIHVVTVQRGLDPREHVLIAFGGAGPMHVVGVASHFGIDHVIAPPQAGVASAIGMQSTDLTAEHGRTHLVRPEALDRATARRLFDEVEAAARAKMGVAGADVAGLVVERSLDVRFVGQAHEVPIPVAGDAPGGADSARDASPDPLAGLDAVPERFRARYRQLYGVAPAGRVEYAAFRVRLRLPVDRPPLVDAAHDPDHSVVAGVLRPAFFGPDEPVGTRVLRRDEVLPGVETVGPAIVEGPVDTLVVPPDWAVASDALGSLHVRRVEVRAGASRRSRVVEPTREESA
ncbi:MAG: hydantoinase/oxoprolinase family protein [Spirochaetaceae bacterium]|nr:hydantoinase/oxoprolinase family protein [Myxococcales bacterium]MCB9724757.1 hydantoinase/oxoprolinase family protein [Spirochaetaceae bacterium]